MAANVHGKLSLKSGYDIGNQSEVIKKVLWPHGFLSKLRNFTNIKPDHLNVEVFSLATWQYCC